MTDQVNIEGTNSVWSQSLPKGRGMHCYGRTSCWAPPISVMNGSGWPFSMNKCRSTGRRKYALPDPCVIFFSCCDMYYHLSQYWSHLFLATMNKCIELRKCAFIDPCLLNFFPSYFGGYYHLSKYSTLFNTLYTVCLENVFPRRKSWKRSTMLCCFFK